MGAGSNRRTALKRKNIITNMSKAKALECAPLKHTGQKLVIAVLRHEHINFRERKLICRTMAQPNIQIALRVDRKYAQIK